MADDLNALFTAALEFGADWRRPVEQLAAERLPHLDAPERARLAALVAESRRAIEGHIYDAYTDVDGEWGEVQQEAVTAWVRNGFPWMNDENLRKAVSQGIYYAWHG